MLFFERLRELYKAYPDSVALSSGKAYDKYTYSMLDTCSARVRSYILKKGIGRENFVMINLPHCVETVIACLGVWRAGAAFVIFETGGPDERRKYIYQDSGCRLNIDMELYKTMMDTEPDYGFAEPDAHDAAYACYTSGTTGVPKGVLHEYGSIDQNILSHYYGDELINRADDKYAFLSSLNFVALLISFPAVLFAGGEFVVVPSEIPREPASLYSFFCEEKITGSFITPSLVRLFTGFNPELRFLFLSSEPIHDLFFENIELYAIYASSESGFQTTVFRIDKPYADTPAGKTNIPDLEIVIRNEQGEKAETFELGDICFENIYFRGYINHSELNGKVFDGPLFISGDMGFRDDDGNLHIRGRKDEMIKINGNRVEPAEIEAVLKDVLQVKWAAVKFFSYNNSWIIAAYYQEEITISVSEVRNQMGERLPYYMIPSVFLHIDTIPVNANGKFSRKMLPDPDLSSHSEYVAPRNQLEWLLTGMFSLVLKRDIIGIDDDFYAIGGDSILTLELIYAVNNPFLSVPMVIQNRTVRRIAEAIQHEKKQSGIIFDEEKKVHSRKNDLDKQFELIPYQQFIFLRQFRSSENLFSTTYNISILIRFNGNPDQDRLLNAVKTVIMRHPILLTTISFSNDGRIVQEYFKNVYRELTVENMSEEEFSEVRKQLIKPFSLLNSPLYRVRIFKTEKGMYLFFEVHHIIADGSSIHLFIRDLIKLLRGDDYEKKLVPDGILDYLDRIRRSEKLLDYQQAKEYLTSEYSGENYSVLPKYDFETNSVISMSCTGELEFSDEAFQTLKKKYGINKNCLLITAFLLTLAKYNSEQKIMATWTYNGRDSVAKNNMFGLLIKDLPIALELTDEYTMNEIYNVINCRILMGMAYYEYPFSFVFDKEKKRDIAGFIFQDDMFDFSELEEISAEKIPLEKHDYATENDFMFSILSTKEGLKYYIEYRKGCYRYESMKRFADLYKGILKKLLSDTDKVSEVLDEKTDALL